MPKIPGINPGQSVSPVSNGVGINPGARDPRGSALQDLGSAVTQLGGYLEDSYQQSEAAKATAQAQKELQDFTVGLRYGTTDEQGRQVPPPSPDKHKELYEQEVERISERAGASLSGKALRMFDSEFTPFTNRHGVVVQERANELFNNGIQANLDETLRYTATSQSNATELEKPGIKSGAFRAIDAVVAQGIITPEQGWAKKKTYIHDSGKADFHKILDSDDERGPDAAIAAIQRGEFGDQPADEQTKMLDQAYARKFQNIQRKNAEITREHTLAEWDQKQAEEISGREGLALWANRKLTPRWVQDNKDHLSFTQQKFFSEAALGAGSTIMEDAETVAELTRSANSGNDIKDAAMRAAIQKKISVDRVATLIGIADGKGIAAEAENAYATGKNYIKLAFDEKIEKRVPGAGIRHAEVESSFRNWLVAHPKATSEQAENEAIGLVARSGIVSFKEQSFTLPVPRGIQSRDSLRIEFPDAIRQDMTKARDENEKLFKAGKRDLYDYKKEKRDIGRWIEIIPKEPPPKSGEKVGE